MKKPAARGRKVTPKIPGASRALQKLFAEGHEVLGIDSLRPGQPEALEHILAGRDLLAVMPTGSGKSLLYQLPSLTLPGLTVVVSPLIALIKDQIGKMQARGVAVCRVDSTLTPKQRREMEALARAPGGKLLLTTPERMADPEFRAMLRESAGNVGVSLFVVDEAHCVSQWGHDFRPAYLELGKAVEDLGRPQVLATTATAPPHVRDDILYQLGIEDAEIVTTTFDRENLHYEVIAIPGDDDKQKTLVTLLKKLPRPGIVYCATVKMVEMQAEKLARHGIPVARYHGRMTKKDRDAEQQRFMADGSELVMIATNAFGLGVDKRDIRYVLHYHVPGSLEAYAQEAGRGGRDGKPARCVLLFSPDDVAIQEFFLKGTYPSRRQVRAVYQTLEAWALHEESPPTLKNLALASRVGAQRTRTVLSLLAGEGFVVEPEEGIYAIADPPPDPAKLADKARQYEARRIADRQRLNALLAYVGEAGCRSQFILRYLGEPDPGLCGRCDNCLRSKAAALAAAREATRLEAPVAAAFGDELEILEADERNGVRGRRPARARLIRIDQPEEPEAVAGEPAPLPLPEEPEVIKTPERDLEHEELEDDDYEDDDYEDDEYEDDDYEDDDDVEVIDRTAADIAEEGFDEEAEITILARKKRPKEEPAARRPVDEEESRPRKRRRKRRRRRRTLLPPVSAFTSPVLSNSSESPRVDTAPRRRSRRGQAAPLVEYVRGPLRINMTPVASATPNDTGPARKSKKKRKRRQGDMSSPPATGNVVVYDERAASGRRKKRRRRRRRSREGGAQIASDAPITFFSTDPSPGRSTELRGNGEGTGRRRRRKKHRRHREDRGYRDRNGSGNGANNGSAQRERTQSSAPPPAPSPSPDRSQSDDS